jgi:hypothetical protein
MTLDEFFAGQEASGAVFEPLPGAVDAVGAAELRVTRNQIAFRGRRAFAWAWMPAHYLRGKHVPLVLSASVGRAEDASSSWKEIVEPVPKRFTHHLELYSAADVDGEVGAWLQEAWEAAG